jgi:hypothetical protein
MRSDDPIRRISPFIVYKFLLSSRVSNIRTKDDTFFDLEVLTEENNSVQ